MHAHTPVLIVGGGPVGLALATELGWRGIACTLIEQGDGSIAWEGIDEVSMAYDTGQERRVTFRRIAERAAKDLIASLP